jgi:hypothetical protein
MEFNAPHGPEDMVFPHTAHVWADAVIWTLAIGCILFAARDGRRQRSGLALMLVAGGAIALLNEPVDDVLGLVWHPRPGQNVVLNTMGPVPMWGLPTYIIFFGFVPFLLLREFEHGTFTLRKFWTGIAITFVLDLLIELPLLQTDLYTYYSRGDVPMSIAGFPLYWMLINTTGPILCAAILFGVPGYFSGWRRPLILLLPVVTDAACSIAVGLPVYTTLHAPGATGAMRWGGALASCAIGLILLDAFARWILAETARRAGGVATPPPGAERASPGVSPAREPARV